MFSPTDRNLEHIAKMLPEEAMALWCDAANLVADAGGDHNAAVRGAWETVAKAGWRRVDGRYLKDNPTASDVHVNAPVNTPADKPKKPKRKNPRVDVWAGGDDEEDVGDQVRNVTLGKDNPNHDELGRFSSGPGASYAGKYKIGTKKPSDMSMSEIEREHNKLALHSSAINQEMIDAGRGYEKPTEIRGKSDPLSQKYKELGDRQQELRSEHNYRSQLSGRDYARRGNLRHPVYDPSMRKFETAAKVCKVDESLGIVMGWAIVCKQNGEDYFDLQGDHIPEDAMLKAAADFMQSSRVSGDMHARDDGGNPIADGSAVFMWPMTADIAKSFGIESGTTGLMIGVKPSAAVLEKFKSGDYTGFSIGGFRIEDEDVQAE